MLLCYNLAFCEISSRHDSVINTLYSGMQCGNCGLRFSQDDKKFYDSHLDWHFHNNRIGRDGRKAASRTWFHLKEVVYLHVVLFLVSEINYLVMN